MGCVLAESARRLRLQQDTDELKQAAARARNGLANAQDSKHRFGLRFFCCCLVRRLNPDL